ncbi:hypothetical protein CP157_03784 (plasmid) [Paracoccus marcusii]|uniref:type II toxin-antitoxin system death-on-curing family toxin n=1 Tax=Paracoccus marcusii TaxID=59779 RepID=UPI001C3D6D8E|nr:type II toxin-antitoxin system death-on-curing family toxin [Paracoccus marcusii]QXI65992.1 hypothetical protein CP157_03784 [Paracoccus marcusii]
MTAFPLPDDLNEVHFLTLEEVDLIHSEILNHGQLNGHKNVTDLQGAIGRPVNAAYYDPHADLVRLAAYYWHGISTSHGYIDGNKRTGFLSMTTFLLANGLHFNAPDFAMGPWVEHLFHAKQFDLDILSVLVKRNTVILTD